MAPLKLPDMASFAPCRQLRADARLQRVARLLVGPRADSSSEVHAFQLNRPLAELQTGAGWPDVAARLSVATGPVASPRCGSSAGRSPT